MARAGGAAGEDDGGVGLPCCAVVVDGYGHWLAGGPQPAGYLAALRSVEFLAERLDDSSLGALEVTARLELRDIGGMLYGFRLRSSDGADLLTGRAAIVLPAPAADMI